MERLHNKSAMLEETNVIQEEAIQELTDLNTALKREEEQDTKERSLQQTSLATEKQKVQTILDAAREENSMLHTTIETMTSNMELLQNSTAPETEENYVEIARLTEGKWYLFYFKNVLVFF